MTPEQQALETALALVELQQKRIEQLESDNQSLINCIMPQMKEFFAKREAFEFRAKFKSIVRNSLNDID